MLQSVNVAPPSDRFEKLLLTYLHELLDPCTGLLTRTQKNRLTPSNSTGLTH